MKMKIKSKRRRRRKRTAADDTYVPYTLVLYVRCRGAVRPHVPPYGRPPCRQDETTLRNDLGRIDKRDNRPPIPTSRRTSEISRTVGEKFNLHLRGWTERYSVRTVLYVRKYGVRVLDLRCHGRFSAACPRPPESASDQKAKISTRQGGTSAGS